MSTPEGTPAARTVDEIMAEIMAENAEDTALLADCEKHWDFLDGTE